jgi:hypothetical protein
MQALKLSFFRGFGLLFKRKSNFEEAGEQNKV